MESFVNGKTGLDVCVRQVLLGAWGFFLFFVMSCFKKKKKKRSKPCPCLQKMWLGSASQSSSQVAQRDSTRAVYITGAPFA